VSGNGRARTPAPERPSLPLAAAAFASGSGSNFQSLLDAQARGAPWRFRLLLSDREEAGALERARRAGVETKVIRVFGRDPVEVGQETVSALFDAAVQVIFLAGYLRLVPARVVEAFRGRILNVHPALLPAFGGKGMYGRRVHEAVLAAGVRVSGATVHLVDEQYDEGDVLAQWPVPVLRGDSPETLAERVLAVEHRLYPLAADRLCRALAAGRHPIPLRPPTSEYREGDPLPSIEPLFQETFPLP
jgi:formyltetrahydrofolate-dependent phosphoribosylglycinamide formyltransferase